MLPLKASNKTICAHHIISKNIHKRRAFALLAAFFLAFDYVEFDLAHTFRLAQVGKAFALVPSVAVFLKLHRFGVKVRMLLIQPNPFYLLLEKAEIAA